nr:MGMT family protein [uncultured Campylobacter sp.]
MWEILLKIPYCKTTTYGQIAREIAAARGLAKMSAQAVGGAVGHNEISIIIPCHRVIGTHGSLTGYGGRHRQENKAAAARRRRYARAFRAPK